MFVTYQHYNVLHVVVLLGVKEGCELLLVCFQVMVLVSHFESPLIAIHHLPVAEAFIGVGIICKSELTTFYSILKCGKANVCLCPSSTRVRDISSVYKEDFLQPYQECSHMWRSCTLPRTPYHHY